MAYRATRTSGVRTSRPAQQQPISRSFVSGGSVRPHAPAGVTYAAAPPAAPVQPAARTAPPAAPQPVKPEMKDRDGDVTMAAADGMQNMDTEELRAQKKKFFQEMKKVTGVRKKPNKQLVQRRLRKHLTPKNATIALQEARPGCVFQFTLMPGSTPPLFTAEVEVDGKKFNGVGSSKGLARAAAAERALQSLVKSPTTVTDEEGKQTEEDTTPWSSLAGFALHKLFCDWREGRVGAPLSLETGGLATNVAEVAASFTSDVTPAADGFQSFSVPKMTRKNGKARSDQKPNPAKQLPTDAVSRHPVMLLHEMRPTVAFEVLEQVMPQAGGVKPSITMQLTVDGQTFKAQASSKKLAKVSLAKTANTAIFGIQYPVDMQ